MNRVRPTAEPCQRGVWNQDASALMMNFAVMCSVSLNIELFPTRMMCFVPRNWTSRLEFVLSGATVDVEYTQQKASAAFCPVPQQCTLAH